MSLQHNKSLAVPTLLGAVFPRNNFSSLTVRGNVGPASRALLTLRYVVSGQSTTNKFFDNVLHYSQFLIWASFNKFLSQQNFEFLREFSATGRRDFLVFRGVTVGTLHTHTRPKVNSLVQSCDCNIEHFLNFELRTLILFSGLKYSVDKPTQISAKSDTYPAERCSHTLIKLRSKIRRKVPCMLWKTSFAINSNACLIETIDEVDSVCVNRTHLSIR